MHVVDASAVIWRFEEKNSLNFANVEFILPPSHTHTPTHISVWLVYVFLSTRYINNWCWYISCCFIYELHSEKSDKSIIIYIFCTGIYYILTEILRNNKTSSNKLNNDPCCHLFCKRFGWGPGQELVQNWFECIPAWEEAGAGEWLCELLEVCLRLLEASLRVLETSAWLIDRPLYTVLICYVSAQIFFLRMKNSLRNTVHTLKRKFNSDRRCVPYFIGKIKREENCNCI